MRNSILATLGVAISLILAAPACTEPVEGDDDGVVDPPDPPDDGTMTAAKCAATYATIVGKAKLCSGSFAETRCDMFAAFDAETKTCHPGCVEPCAEPPPMADLQGTFSCTTRNGAQQNCRPATP